VDFDVIVVGAGAGGLMTAARLALHQERGGPRRLP
jgi:phytoene dehydrogenase-like protein